MQADKNPGHLAIPHGNPRVDSLTWVGYIRALCNYIARDLKLVVIDNDAAEAFFLIFIINFSD